MPRGHPRAGESRKHPPGVLALRFVKAREDLRKVALGLQYQFVNPVFHRSLFP